MTNNLQFNVGEDISISDLKSDEDNSVAVYPVVAVYLECK